MTSCSIRYWFDLPTPTASPATVSPRVQTDGTCWVGGAYWQGRDVMRISISNWSTTEKDIEVSADAIVRAFKAS